MSPETLAGSGLVVARFISMIAAFGCAGALTLTFITFTSIPEGTRLEDALRTYGLAAAILFCLSALGRLLAQSYSIFGVDEGLSLDLIGVVAFQTSWGDALLSQFAVGIILTLSWGAARFVKQLGVASIIAATVGLFASWPTTSHAAAHEPATWFALLTQAGHTAAGGAWIGSLGLLVLLVTRRVDADAWDRSIAVLVNQFSPIALGAAGVLTLTGLASSTMFLGQLSDLWTSGYGRFLSLKVMVFGGVLVMGAWNWRRVRPKLGTTEGTVALRRTASVEAVLAMVVLALTAVFVGMPLPHE